MRAGGKHPPTPSDLHALKKPSPYRVKDMGFDVDNPKGRAKSKIPKYREKQIEWYIEEIDDNAKQFARELNKLPTSEDNRDNIILQENHQQK